MTNPIKAKRAKVLIGSIEVDGFQLPDGSYCMSQTQTAECISDDPVYARNFLRSKTFKSLQGEGYTPETFEVEKTEPGRGQTRIQGWTLEIVYFYWVYRCSKGSQQAFNLVLALGTETLERRFDKAFGIERSEAEYDNQLSEHIRQLETDLQQLGEAYAMEDEIRQERDYFEQLLRDNGIDPWRLPNQEQ